MNVTLIKKDRGKATRSKADFAFVVQLMQEQRLRYQINQFWEHYPIMREHPQFLDEEMREFTSNLPEVCFASEHRKLCHELHADHLNHLVVLTADNPLYRGVLLSSKGIVRRKTNRETECEVSFL